MLNITSVTKHFLISVYFFLLTTNIQANDFNTVNRVLDYLYQTNGNKKIIKPNLEIIESEKDAARFIRRTNTIQIGRKAIAICRSFGKDSLSALGFVIGHELSHSFQTEASAAKVTGFLAYDKSPKSDIAEEEDADIQGIFICYLAGYKTVTIIPELIEKMYDAYGLNKGKLNGYPDFKERQQSAKQIQNKVIQLIQLYEVACQLVALGQLDLALVNFEYVEKYYKGREIYNNLGICNALLALNTSDKNIQQFIIPFELEWDTRLKKPYTSRSDENDDAAVALRKKHLDKAEQNFQKANKLDLTYFNAEINLFCTYALNGKMNKATKMIEKSSLIKRATLLHLNTQEILRAQLATAFYYASNGSNDKAKIIWNDIAQSDVQWAKYQAEYNLHIFNKMPIASYSDNCQSSGLMTSSVDDVLLHRAKGNNNWISLNPNYKVSIEQKAHSNVIVFKKENTVIFVLQRVFNDLKITPIDSSLNYSPINFTLTSKGVFKICSDNKILEHHALNENVIMEWVKYYAW